MEQICYRIISTLQANRNSTRGIAKTLNTNHMTISRKIKILETKNILDFREEGRNKIYFLKETIETKETLKMLEHNKLLQLINRHPRIRKIVEKIQKKKDILAIIFGSYAKGYENKESDIDIYIKSTNINLKKEIELIDSKINLKIGEFDQKNLLIKEIIKNHVIIKGVEKYYELIH